MKYFYLLLLSIIPAAVFSQTNFQKGYIIKTTGDTVHGYINYQEWNHNPKAVNFKHSQQTKETSTYKPEEIKGFYVDGYDTYRSYKGPISLGKTQGTDLSTDIDTTTVQANVFLKVIVNDEPLKLYEYTDDIKARYFIQENGESPAELGYSVFYSRTDDNHVESNERYKRQLTLLALKYAPENTKIGNKIRPIEYNERALTAIITLINNKPQQGKAAKQASFRFFAGGGINITQTKYSGESMFAASKAGQSATPIISIGMDFFSNPHVQRLIFRAELLYSSINPTFQVQGNNGLEPYVQNAAINQRTITFLPQVIYNFYNTEKLKIYGGAGFGANYSTYNNTYYQIINNGRANEKVPYQLEAYWVKFPVEAGVVINKRIEINFKYSLPSSFSNYVNYSISNTEYQFGVHYLFGKKY